MFISEGTLHQTLTILPASLCEFCLGVGYGWAAPTLKQLKYSDGEFALTTEECSWTASLPEFFKFIGAILVCAFADVVGRKRLYLLCPILFVISWSVLVVKRSASALYVGRSIFGLAAGINDVLALIYVVENGSPRTRGIFTSLYVSSFMGGVLTGYVLCMRLNYNAVILVNLIINFFPLLPMLAMKESAQFLIMRGRLEEAENVFYWLRASESDDTKLEFEDMTKNVPQTTLISFFRKIFSDKANRKSVLTVLVMNVLITVPTGKSIVAFRTVIYSQLATTISPEQLTVVDGVLVFVSLMVSALCVERFNRKTILFAGFFGNSVINFTIAILYHWQENVFQLPYFGWLIFSLFLCAHVLCCSTVVPMYNLMSGELLLQSVRPLGSFLTVSTNSLCCFAVSAVFLPVAEAYGLYVNFAFFSVCGLIAIVYVYWCIPETRGKSLMEIQKIFEN